LNFVCLTVSRNVVLLAAISLKYGFSLIQWKSFELKDIRFQIFQIKKASSIRLTFLYLAFRIVQTSFRTDANSRHAAALVIGHGA
jgi:hypothetical protein